MMNKIQKVATIGTMLVVYSAAMAAPVPVPPPPAKYAKQFNATKLKTETTLDAPISTVTLPGVGTYASNDKLTHGSVLKATDDGNQTGLVSNIFPNRIATPFPHAKVIGEDSKLYTTQEEGSNILLATVSSKPFVIFVTGHTPGDPVITMTLVPRAIPSQTLTIELDTSKIAQRKAKTNSYESKLLELLRTIASGKTPEGFTEAGMPNIVATEKRDGLNITPEKRYSGTYLDVYKYRVDDNQQPIQLSETSFYQKGVRAVSIFPKIRLDKGDHTYVFVVADKSLLDGDANARSDQ